jgi:hypothetical protein
VAEIKDKEPNPDSESDSENTGKRQIIDADPTVVVATTAIQPEESTDPEEGERLFHSNRTKVNLSNQQKVIHLNLSII